MSVIDGKRNNVVKTVTVGIQPKGVTVGSKSSRINVDTRVQFSVMENKAIALVGT